MCRTYQSDLEEAMGACLLEVDATAQPFELSLRFEPVSGALQEVNPSTTANAGLARCMQAKLPPLIRTVPFEPRSPGTSGCDARSSSPKADSRQ